MGEPRHEAVVAAVMLGLIKAHGWMEMPIAIDVNKAVAMIKQDGGLAMERGHAVVAARGLIDRACEANGWDKPDYTPEDESRLVLLLAQVYDELLEDVGRER